MTVFHTIDHDEIRSWVEKHGGRPALIPTAPETDSEGILTLTFEELGPEARHITWNEFFIIFDLQHLQFRYEEPLEAGEDSGWAFAFEDRGLADMEDAELPDAVDDVDENIFPSAP